MKCKIDGCTQNARYKKDQVCQKHYFRFMRYGTYELTSVRKYRIENAAGYQKIYEPSHFLAGKDGYVYEHRFVYSKSNRQVKLCEMCGVEITWKTVHIDHIDNNVKNNEIDNLRPLCRACNVFRAHNALSQGKLFITLNDITLTPTAWARQPNVNVSSLTIRRRYLSGFSAFESIYGDKITHKLTASKKIQKKYDVVRGIIIEKGEPNLKQKIKDLE